MQGIITELRRLSRSVEELTEKQDERDATSQATAEHMRQLSTLASGGVGVSLQMYQMMVQNGVHPTNLNLLPCKRSAAERDCTQVPTSKAARVRHKAEVKWQQHAQAQRVALLTGAQDDHQQQTLATSQPAATAVADSSLASEQPLGETAEAAASMSATLGQPTEPSLPTAAPQASGPSRPAIPGTGQSAPWTEWQGAYPVLRGTHTVCVVPLVRLRQAA